MSAASFDAMNRENRLAQEEAAALLTTTEPDNRSGLVRVRVLDPSKVNSELGAKAPGDEIELASTAASQLIALGIAEEVEQFDLGTAPVVPASKKK